MEEQPMKMERGHWDLPGVGMLSGMLRLKRLNYLNSVTRFRHFRMR